MKTHVRMRAYDSQKARNFNLLRLYNITEEVFQQMLISQGSVCAICRTQDWGPHGPHVDHCHATGKVRSILCGLCNKGLGNFKDDPDRLRTAADYVELHRP